MPSGSGPHNGSSPGQRGRRPPGAMIPAPTRIHSFLPRIAPPAFRTSPGLPAQGFGPASRGNSAWLYCKKSSRCEVRMLTVMGGCSD